jgi:hypothetical protein
MKILSRNINTEVQYLLGNNYEGIHARLLEILSPEEARLFARPQNRRASGQHFWYAEEDRTYRSYTLASEEQKNEISDQLHLLAEKIKPKLLQDPDLAHQIEEIFRFPDEAKVFFYESDQGEVVPIITQWGCKPALGGGDSNPFIKIVERPRDDHTRITLNARYSYGAQYAKKNILFAYKDRKPKELYTDEEGRVYLGYIKQGEHFAVTDGDDMDLTRAQTFTCQSEETLEAIFPYYLDLQVQVVNQRQEPQAQKEIWVTHQGNKSLHTTDEQGQFKVERLLLTEDSLLLQSKDDEAIQQSYELSPESESLTFVLQERFYGEVELLVRNDQDEAIPNYGLNLQIDGKTQQVSSSETGSIKLGKIPAEVDIRVQEAPPEVNAQSFQVAEGKNQFIVRVNPPLPAQVAFFLLDHEDKAIPNTDFELKGRQEPIQLTADETGKALLTEPPFDDKEKIKASIFLKREGKKPKKRSVRFTFDQEQKEYYLKLKKINWRWLWLLLLLLPLLLLIRCEKAITVQAINATTQQPVKDAHVKLSYHEEHLFYKGKLPYDEQTGPLP